MYSVFLATTPRKHIAQCADKKEYDLTEPVLTKIDLTLTPDDPSHNHCGVQHHVLEVPGMVPRQFIRSPKVPCKKCGYTQDIDYRTVNKEAQQWSKIISTNTLRITQGWCAAIPMQVLQCL